MPVGDKKAAAEKPEENAAEETKDVPVKVQLPQLSSQAPEPRGGADDLRRIVAMIEKAVETNQVCRSCAERPEAALREWTRIQCSEKREI
jgi:hypothetical protein